MANLPLKSQSLWIYSLVLVCILIGLLAPSPVRAGGAQPVLPGGSSLKPGEGTTTVQMAAEIVTINIRPATAADNALVLLTPRNFAFRALSSWFPAIAEVEADFTMKNPTSEAVSLTAWFPLASALEKVDWNTYLDQDVPRLESFQVSVDGHPVNYAISELPNPGGVDKPRLPWAGFQVAFPSGTETVTQQSII